MAEREWILLKPDKDAVRALEASGYSGLLSRLLVNRGIESAQEARAFLTGGQALFDPFRLRGMKEAAERVHAAIESGEKIVVYGDYDVDGVTATALLLTYLRKKGADASYYIPAREGEGYGLNAEAARAICAGGAGLIVTVDTGISAMEEAKLIKSLGADLVITDHHEPRKELPEALAIVNPKQVGCDYPFKELAGVGVAFKLACALEGQVEPVLEEYGGLVALGTVADVVPLAGENRELCRRGLALMKSRPGCGLRALLEAAGVCGQLSSGLLSFTAAPRINAAGRMGSAADALKLLTEQDEKEAAALARRLDDSNRQRQEIEGGILEEAVGKIESTGCDAPVLMVCGEGWHNGVIGIVASRLAELYLKPAILVSFEGGEGRASCRSFPGFNIHDALSCCAPLLERYGGHALAAGFTVRRENYDILYDSLQRYARSLPAMPQPSLKLEHELSPGDLTLASARECKKLEPCGAGNPEPLFYLRAARVVSVTPLKEGRHLRLSLRTGGVNFKAMLFNAPRRALSAAPGEIIDCAVQLDVNPYNGSEYLSVIIRELRPSRVFEEGRLAYQSLLSGQASLPADGAVLPVREDFAAVYRCLFTEKRGSAQLREAFASIREIQDGFTFTKLLIILDVFSEMKLVTFSVRDDHITYEINQNIKVNLKNSRLLSRLSGGMQGNAAETEG